MRRKHDVKLHIDTEHAVHDDPHPAPDNTPHNTTLHSHSPHWPTQHCHFNRDTTWMVLPGVRFFTIHLCACETVCETLIMAIWQAIEDTNIRTTHLYTSPITIHTLTLLADMFYTIYVSGERQRIHHRHDEGCVLPCFMTTLYDYTCAVQTVCVACDS